MPVLTDLPRELRDFNRIFQKFEYRHDSSEVWRDFLNLFIKEFSFDDCEELNKDIRKRYTQEERYVFGELIQEAIKVMHGQLRDDTDWYDLFGTFYEVLGCLYKRKGFNQYFSQASLIELMTQLTGNVKELSGKGLLVGDPTCGSGRMIISFHAHYPGNFLVGQDLDLICCKMTIMNMVLHGASGEVVWGNTLDPEDFRRGWRITPYIAGIPQVYEIDKSESLTYQMWQNRKAKILTQEAGKVIIQEQIKPEKKQPVQLELNFI